jgi:geranylgeranyl reductase family protein
MASIEYYDAVIVGGGPAGSSSARALSEAGMKVLVMDKSTFPRHKVCAGWITPEVVELTELDPEEYRQGRTLQPIRSFRTGLLGRQLLTTHYDDVVSYGILRSEFDLYLLERSGAKLRLGEAFSHARRHNTDWMINGNILTPLLIGAGGHACPVARMLNRRRKDTAEVVVAQEVEFELSPEQDECCLIRSDTPELFFLPELDGYGWCFRKGDHINIGLGRTDNRKLGAYVEQFRRFLIAQGKLPEDIPGKFHGHAYRLASGHSARKVVDYGTLLAGDAVGLAYPQSGEGIRCAIESGILAADTAIDANGDYRCETMSYYARDIDEHYRHRSESLPLPHTVRQMFARMVLSNSYLTRRVVLDNWFLHRA